MTNQGPEYYNSGTTRQLGDRVLQLRDRAGTKIQGPRNTFPGTRRTGTTIQGPRTTIQEAHYNSRTAYVLQFWDWSTVRRRG